MTPSVIPSFGGGKLPKKQDKSTSPKNAVTTDPCHSATPGAGPQHGRQGAHSQQAVYSYLFFFCFPPFFFLFFFPWVKHKPIVNDVIDVFDWFSYYLVHLVFYLVNSL